MKKLWIFGDSFSDGCGLGDDNPYAQLKQKELGIDSIWNLTWENLLAKELGLEIERHGFGGAGNTEIIMAIMQNLNNFQKDDYIIVGWTNPTRVSLPSPIGYPHGLVTLQNDRTASWYDGEYKNSNYYDFYVNTFFPNIEKHCKYWTEIGEELLIHLSQIYNVKSWFWPEYVSEIHTIADDTNKQIFDIHPSITGHLYLKEIIKSIPWGKLNSPIVNLNSNTDNAIFNKSKII